MREDDPSLDAALAALAGMRPPELEDDDRWAKRVASRVSTFSPPSRRELDPFLAPPLPDDHQDFDEGAAYADDLSHADHTAAAADYGDAHGWEGSMSDDEHTSRPPNSLAGLSGLTRSGPASATDSIEGAAKGDDSGLIDLRAMNQAAESPAEEPVAEAAPATAAAAPVASLSKTAPEAPSSISASKIAVPAAVASTASANAVPPSSTTATAASAPAAAAGAPQQKKGGAGLWIALGGLAAAAAAAFFFVGPFAKKDEASTASAPAASQAATPKPEEKVAVAEKPSASSSSTPEPEATAAPAPTEEPAAPGATAKAPVAKASSTSAVAPDPKAAAAKPTASAAPTAETPKSAGTGSLDDVLGIGKDQPAKKAEPTDNLPDKPDSMDVRSAINSKLSAANACVKGLEGPSNASVTFGPTGAVSGVVVTSGPAKGTGAEACVKSAFSSAKVPASKKGASGSATLMP